MYIQLLSYAKITPIYRNASERTGPTNYRPITVIPVEPNIFK